MNATHPQPQSPRATGVVRPARSPSARAWPSGMYEPQREESTHDARTVDRGSQFETAASYRGENERFVGTSSPWRAGFSNRMRLARVEGGGRSRHGPRRSAVRGRKSSGWARTIDMFYLHRIDPVRAHRRISWNAGRAGAERQDPLHRTAMQCRHDARPLRNPWRQCRVNTRSGRAIPIGKPPPSRAGYRLRGLQPGGAASRRQFTQLGICPPPMPVRAFPLQRQRRTERSAGRPRADDRL